MKKKAHKELKLLFGEPVAYLAQITDIANLDLSEELMEAVHDGADTLLTMRGQPKMQQRYIERMSFTTRLVLCMWLMDTEMASKLIRAVYAKG